jgi:hypothetical protein
LSIRIIITKNEKYAQEHFGTGTKIHPEEAS